MIPITKKGYEALMKKLAKLREEASQIPAIIAKARARGDLKENAEYHAARERQGLINAQITKLQSDIQNSKIIDPSTLPEKVVNFGKKVTLVNLDNDQVETYILTGPSEGDDLGNALSVTSQLARGIMGKRENEKISVTLPKGAKRYLIKKIEFS